jgi:hypothetical protein
MWDVTRNYQPAGPSVVYVLLDCALMMGWLGRFTGAWRTLALALLHVLLLGNSLVPCTGEARRGRFMVQPILSTAWVVAFVGAGPWLQQRGVRRRREGGAALRGLA